MNDNEFRNMRAVGVGGFEGTNEMLQNVKAVLDSGQLSYRGFSETFEKEFAEQHGVDYAILSNSGTSALLVALQAMKEEYGWRDGSEIIVPATTFVATANIVIHCNLRPVFVDVDWDLNIDIHKIEAAVTGKTVGIIPVHLCGRPADMSNIMHFAGLHNLKVIEDSCESMFAHHEGKPVGSWGHIGCFSTYVAHMITMGVGGISTTNDPALAARMRSLVNHGLSMEYLNPDDGLRPRPMGNRRFQFSAIGHSFRITEMEAAIGLPQLRSSTEIIKTRNRNAKHLAAGLKKINLWGDKPFLVFEPDPVDYRKNAWMIYPILLREGVSERYNNEAFGDYDVKESLMAYLNSNGVETRDLMPLLGQPVAPYKYLKKEDFPVSEFIRARGFYVGCHQYLKPDDIKYVIHWISEYFSKTPV